MIDHAGPWLERIELFNYGEPFLYRHLLDMLRHTRLVCPTTGVAISTDGMWMREPVEAAIVDERPFDWIIFSIDGCEDESYRRCRIRGRLNTAIANFL